MFISVTGFNVWAAVLSVGIVCTFYTTLVSNFMDESCQYVLTLYWCNETEKLAEDKSPTTKGHPTFSQGARVFYFPEGNCFGKIHLL